MKNVKIDINFWETFGYYQLFNFFDDEAINHLTKFSEKTWDNRDENIVVDTQIYSHTESRIRNTIANLSEDERKRRYVLNDIHLHSMEARNIALDPTLLEILQLLLKAKPILTQSLNFKWGTAQGLHQDTVFLPPPPGQERLVAIWVALEDVEADAGPLVYVPKSHQIPKYRFSNGSLGFIESEVPNWEFHVKHHMNKLNLNSQLNLARKGDVFIWEGYLLHGGSEIKNFSKTRKSFVCHYYCFDDVMKFANSLEILRNETGGSYISYHRRNLNPIKPWEMVG